MTVPYTDPPFSGAALRETVAASWKEEAERLLSARRRRENGPGGIGQELKYLKTYVHERTDGLGALISTNKEAKARAGIPDDAGVHNASIDMQIDVDKSEESAGVVTPARVAQLKKLAS